jgi:hypothetical protein
MLVSLGKISVTTAGTPVQFTSTTTNCNAFFIEYPFASQTGPNVYIGKTGLVKATLVGVWRKLALVAAATAVPDKWDVISPAMFAPFDLSTFYVDADASSDYILVSYLT